VVAARIRRVVGTVAVGTSTAAGRVVLGLLLVLAATWLAPPAGSSAAPALAPLSVSGKHLMRAGRPYAFRGVNRDSLEWGRFNWGGCGGDGHFTAADMDRIRSWNADVVRVPLSQAGWLGRRCDAADYRRRVDEAVELINDRGMYAILDLHWSDVGGAAPCDAGCLTGQQPMPDANSVVFWRQVATRYADRPGVVFNLFNEPHGVSWSCWRNGGCTTSSSTPSPATGRPVRYAAVGMQRLLDTVRRQGASNLVLVGGLDWAYDLSGVGNGYALRGSDVAYDTHVYTRWHSTEADWDRHFGFLTARVPVTATEFGSTDCSTDVTRRLLDYFDAPMGNPANRMSWTIWAWNDPGTCSQPSLLADWDGTPLAGQGQLIRDRLRAGVPPAGAARAAGRASRRPS
jgi:aryl-phospho-beta-D-glucosidase BglC (GH1 family)